MDNVQKCVFMELLFCFRRLGTYSAHACSLLKHVWRTVIITDTVLEIVCKVI